MRKRFIYLITIIIISFILTSCGIGNSKSNDTIQLWSYFNSPGNLQSKSILMIIDSVKTFCEENNIPIEINTYASDTLSLEDYKIKRNIAAARGNMIIIDDISNMRDLMKKHADYTRLENYDKLIDIYKGEFCIPLAIKESISSVDYELMKFYNLSSNKQFITHRELLDIKQNMKKRGAEFELNRHEILEVINYYLYSNELLFLNENSEILKDDINLKKKLKKTVLDVCNDITQYYNSNLELSNDTSKLTDSIDMKSGISFEYNHSNKAFLHPYEAYYMKTSIANKIFFIYPKTIICSPSFFMYKKITNDKIYDLANYIVSEETSLMIIKDSIYSPVFKGEKTKDFFKINEKNEYIGDEENQETKEIINTRLDILLNDRNESKELANNFFCNKDYIINLNLFSLNLIYDIAKQLSGGKLSLENFDSNDIEINKMLDEKINEFVFNFKMQNQ